MANTKEKKDKPIEYTNIIHPHQGEGAYGFSVLRVPKELVEKAELVEDYQNDVFQAFLNNIHVAARRIFGI